MIGEYTTKEVIKTLLKGGAYAELKKSEVWLESQKINRKINITEVDMILQYRTTMELSTAIQFIYEWMIEVNEYYVIKYKVSFDDWGSIKIHLGVKAERNSEQITIGKAIEDFQTSMQDVVDKEDGVSKISVSSPSYNNGEEVVIAERKPRADRSEIMEGTVPIEVDDFTRLLDTEE